MNAVKTLFTCEFCSANFREKKSLRRHELRHRAGKKPCMICGKTFVCNSALRRHLRVHTGEKPYSCSTCDRQFSESSNLRRHMRTHADQKPIVSSSSSSRRKNGCNTPSENHDDQEFQCSVCDKSFCSAEHFRRHRRKHTVYMHFQRRFVNPSIVHHLSDEGIFMQPRAHPFTTIIGSNSSSASVGNKTKSNNLPTQEKASASRGNDVIVESRVECAASNDQRRQPVSNSPAAALARTTVPKMLRRLAPHNAPGITELASGRRRL